VFQCVTHIYPQIPSRFYGSFYQSSASSIYNDKIYLSVFGVIHYSCSCTNSLRRHKNFGLWLNVDLSFFPYFEQYLFSFQYLVGVDLSQYVFCGPTIRLLSVKPWNDCTSVLLAIHSKIDRVAASSSLTHFIKVRVSCRCTYYVGCSSTR